MSSDWAAPREKVSIDSKTISAAIRGFLLPAGEDFVQPLKAEEFPVLVLGLGDAVAEQDERILGLQLQA